MAAMKVLLLLVFVSVLAAKDGDLKRHASDDDSEVICGVNDDNVEQFRKTLYDFTMTTYKGMAAHSKGHFVISALSIWQSLAAIAEGSGGVTRQELFQLLGLPEDECERHSYYQLAAFREPEGPDVSIARTRLFFVDEELEVDSEWEKLALQNFNLITTQVPLKRAPHETAFTIRNTISSQLATLNFQGNSVLTDYLDYNGLWTEAFPETSIVRSPFFDHNGHQIGSIDMMRTKMRVRLAFIERLNAKMVEIPVGHNGRYRMLFGIPVEGHDLRQSFPNITNTIIFEILDKLKETHEPIDIAIPQFLMTTESDVRALLEEIGVKNIWSDAGATGSISHPAAVPSTFIQRVQVTLDTYGVGPHAPVFTEHETTGLDPKLGNEVVLDRPFMYGLFDAETYTCLFGAAYSVPTYGLHN